MPTSIDMPPPPPSMVGSAAPPKPSLGGLAGQQSQPQPQDQSIQLVTQHLMEAKQALQAAARIKPELSAIVDAFISQVEPQAGRVLFNKGQTESTSSQAPTPSLMAQVSPGI